MSRNPYLDAQQSSFVGSIYDMGMGLEAQGFVDAQNASRQRQMQNMAARPYCRPFEFDLIEQARDFERDERRRTNRNARIGTVIVVGLWLYSILWAWASYVL